MREDRNSLLGFFGLDEEELVAVVLVLLLVFFLGLFWIRGIGNDPASVDGEANVAAESVAADATGISFDGDFSNSGQLQLEGVAHSNANIDIFMDGDKIGSTRADVNGNWSYSKRIRDAGDHEIVARSYMNNGKSFDSSTFAFAGVAAAAAASTDGASDAVEPTAEVEEERNPRQTAAAVAPTIADGLDSQTVPFGPVAVNGTAEGGSMVDILVDDVVVGSAESDADGNWSTELALGTMTAATHTIVASRNDDPDVRSNTATIAMVPPIASAFIANTDGVRVAPGEYSIKGTGQPNWVVAYRAAGQDELNFAKTDPQGNWAGNFNFAEVGDYNLEVYSVDGDGNPLELGQTALVTAFDQTAAAVPEAEPTEAPAETPEEPTAEPEPTEAPEEPTAEPEPTDEPAQPDLIDLMEADGRFSTLLQALSGFGLTDQFRGEGPFTVFAPTDEAFASLPEGALDTYLNNPAMLTAVLTQHVVAGEFLAADVLAAESLTSIGEQAIAIDPAAVTANGASIIETDLDASNGVAHAIGRIMLPAGDFSPPIIDVQGVPTFKGSPLTVVGLGQPGWPLRLELNGELFGETTIAEDGTWLVSNELTPGEYEIIAYQYEPGGVLRAISNIVNLIAE